MDFNARSPGKLCVLIWIFSFLKQTGLAQNHSAPPMLMTSPTLIAAVVRPLLTNHNGQVCSTWGNFHYKTFDGEIFNFPGTCNYIFSSHCKGNYEDFNIQIRRTMVNSIPTISHITIKIDAVVVEMFNKSIMVDGVIAEKLPLGQSKIHIERSGVYLKIVAKLGLVFMWNEDDSMLMELNTKYTNQTCGLCGDFNGISGYSEFMFNGIKLNPVQFGNLQQLDGPMEDCNNPTPIPQDNCLDQEKICERILLSSAFSSCNKLVEADPYIKACVQDLCHCNSENHSCLCNTFAEYSRQCAHAGGQPEKWRTQELCFRKCPFNMEHKECGSPCADSCSNPERALVCEDHCIDGCICPTGTVLDDINHTGCIPQEECFCVYNSEIYSPGSSYSTPCRACTCSRGKWKCKEIPCTGSCSIEGGSHITTFDQTHYTVHGDCSYVLVKLCNQSNVMVQAEMYRCGLSERNTCLKSVMLGLQGGQTVVVIKPSGHVFFNWMVTQLPISAANVTIFRPSSFYIIVQTTLGLQLQIQLTPIMQVHMILDPSYQDQTCGLCGNFNNVQTDDFRAISGLIEGTAAAFANTWKTQFDCPNIKNIYEDPCSFSVENERYAQHWCALLTDPAGPFAQCHSLVNPLVYHSKCLFATCSCKDSEDCMCAALSSYVYACAKKGIALLGWRATVCKKYTESCEKSQTYSYSVTRCQPTCRARSETDVTCGIEFVPVDGCVCIEGFYMDDSGTCVMPSSCPCYYKGIAMESGEMFQENGLMCICNLGQLSCVGGIIENPACSPPMVYFDCTNVTVGTKGAECQKSCHTLDMDCYSSQCVSGCICPQGLVSDGRGSCIFEQECPCIHNEATYLPGENIAVGCNTCTCMARRWHCTHKACLGTCAVYGNGHYITFDGKHYGFSGDCEYTLAQDHGGQGGSTFRVITENIPCGTTGTACSKDIKIFLGGYELLLDDAKLEVVKRNETNPIRYEVQNRGIYLVIRAGNGLVLMWDKKTSIFIKLSPDFKGKVCGLCGNYDGNANNDFTTRSQSVVENEMEFFNSWKLSPTCPDVLVRKDPCLANPYRKPWAQKQCGIITSKTFLPCHSQVDPVTYYEACISDACTCDAGGDCECFCTAVASYAQACGEAGVCIKWRTPTICPLFCDYYNTAGECEWHYKPCGFPCMKTCRNLKGVCQYDLPGSEGCYPICPANKPYFNEDTLKCVSQCGCYDHEGNLHNPGEKWFLPQNCHSCECTLEGLACGYDIKACRCEYGGKIYHYMDRIDGVEGCNSMICDGNGTIVNITSKCSTTVLPSSLPNQIETTSGKAPYSYQTEKPPSPTSTSSAIIRTSTLSTTSIDRKSSTSSTSASPVTRETNSPLTMSLVSKSRSNPPSSTTAISKGTSISPTITSTSPTIFTTEKIRTESSIESTTSTITTYSGTSCVPQCYWTRWFDENHPRSDNEGDIESYEVITAKGINVCKSKIHLTSIHCRAKNYPEVPLLELEQVIQCDVLSGLVCRNQDNRGLRKMCLNYEIRLKCCDDYSYCPTSPLSITSKPTTSTSSVTTETSIFPTSSSSVTIKTSTSPTSIPSVTEETSNSLTATSSVTGQTSQLPSRTSSVTTEITNNSTTSLDTTGTSTFPAFTGTFTFPISTPSVTARPSNSPTTSSITTGTSIFPPSTYSVSTKTSTSPTTTPSVTEETSISLSTTSSVTEQTSQLPSRSSVTTEITNNSTSLDTTGTSTFPAFTRTFTSPISTPSVTARPSNSPTTSSVTGGPIPTCKVEEMWTIVQYGDCLANVTLTHCEGLCSSLSRYSPSSKKIEHNCSCCQESSTSIKEIQLECGDGTSVGYTYQQVEECHCQQGVCDLGA